ncbi:MAG: hypothetical protein R3B90_20155 [Planctomycetaceae bacterium]
MMAWPGGGEGEVGIEPDGVDPVEGERRLSGGGLDPASQLGEFQKLSADAIAVGEYDDVGGGAGKAAGG